MVEHGEKEAATWKPVCPSVANVSGAPDLNRQNWFSRVGARVLPPMRAAQGELVAVGQVAAPALPAVVEGEPARGRHER
jgi:hypothetical protein